LLVSLLVSIFILVPLSLLQPKNRSASPGLGNRKYSGRAGGGASAMFVFGMPELRRTPGTVRVATGHFFRDETLFGRFAERREGLSLVKRLFQ
jgi:hypothetical protein